MSELWSFLKERMLTYPLKIIKDENRQYTYKEIIDIVENKAISLKNQKYAIMCKSELDTAIWILSVVAAGKTAVPLSHCYGEKHYSKIIDIVKPNSFIKNNEIFEMESYKDDYDEETLYDVAFIMCTSGTTGVPKGAMITHKNIITNVSDIERYFKINEDDSILISRPLYHCAVLTGEFLISLVKGLSIHIINEGFNPAKSIEYIFNNRISVYCNTPSNFYYLCKFAKDNKMLSSVKRVAVSGECMSEKVADLMIEKLLDADIYNVYGLTEASPRVAYLEPSLFKTKPLSIGDSLYSVKIRIVDVEEEYISCHTEGELLIKGDSVMKGYYRDRKKTENIIRNGWLYTGDIAKSDNDGHIYIISRKDDMIIKGGMNIYPQEIENTLSQDERIKEVLVYGFQSELGQKIAIDVVVNSKLTVKDIIHICNNKLVEFQRPDIVNIVTQLEKNGSGKVVRKNHTNKLKFINIE